VGVGSGQPPGGGEPTRGESPWDHEPPPRRGLSRRAKIAAGVFVGALYAVGMSARGELLPGVVGGVLAGVLCFLVLRGVERQRRHRG
jgi:hypothetical protein